MSKRRHKDNTPPGKQEQREKENTNRHVYVEPGAKIDFVEELKNKHDAEKRDNAAHQANQLRWTKIGTGLVFLYTLINIFLYCAAKDSADAAFRSVAVAKDTAVKQLRPYVGAEPNFLENLAPNDTTTVQGIATNYGQTPGYRTRVYFDVQVLPYPLPDDLPFPFSPPKGTDFGSIATLFPHAPLPVGKKMNKPLTKDEAYGVYDGTKIRLYVGGEIWYDDVYDTPYCTRFLAVLGGPELVEWAHDVRIGQKMSLPWRVWKKFNDEKCQQTQQ